MFDDLRGSFNLGAVAIGAAIILMVVLGFMCTTKIMPGYAGVVYSMNGGLENETLSQGYQLVAPWKRVVEYPISTETVYYSKNPKEGDKEDHSIMVNTKDGKQVNVDITYSYHMNPDKLSAIFEKFRGQDSSVIESNFMKNEMYQAVNEVTSQYSLMEMIGDKRPDVNAKIFNKFRDNLSEYGIDIETFNLSRIAPDDQTLQAIQNVVNAQNALAQAKIEQQQAEVEAEKARSIAKGKADATVIEAQGQADANAKVQQSLTPMLIQYQYATRWDGKYPNVVAGSGSGMLFNITQ